MTFTNNLYLVIAGTDLLTLATGQLWPGLAPGWAKVHPGEIVALLVMASCAFLPGFTWEARGLLLATLALNLALFLRQRRRR